MDWVRWVVGWDSGAGVPVLPVAGGELLPEGRPRRGPSSLQILQNSANLPMVAKPLYGLLSDAVPIRAQRRLPYVAIGAFLQAISWLAIALLSESSPSIAALTVFLLLSNLGASIAEVANDAIVAEAGKKQSSAAQSGSGQLQSFAWMAGSSAGALGNLLGGIAINKLSPKTMFLLFSLLLLLQFIVTLSVPESSLGLPQRTGHSSKSSGLREQLSELSFALRKPEIFYLITWFSASYAIVPLLAGTMFFYQTQHLNLDSSVIGLSKVFGQAAVLAWSVAYDKYLKGIPARKVIAGLQFVIGLFMISDALFVQGIYRMIGLPDSVYVVLFSGLLEALFLFKVLPFSVLMAQLCPLGCEGSLMAFVMSALALSSVISGYFGVALAAFVGVSGTKFSGLSSGILIQAVFTMLPLFWSPWIPDKGIPEKKKD
uniref:Folate-biopterin transporter 7 n=1 Tax=Ananas comosus var. bracteatus TaxID=296719 RepID=A0A6V7QYK9_ANACO